MEKIDLSDKKYKPFKLIFAKQLLSILDDREWYFDPTSNIYNSMVAAFSSAGLPNNDADDKAFQGGQPAGAVCQFQ